MMFTVRSLSSGLLAVGLSLAAGVAQAAVTWSDVVDIAIPTSFNGVYLDLAAGTPSTPASNDPAQVNFDSYAVGYGAPASWDVNFFFGGIGIAYSPTFNPFVETPGDARSQILNVAFGTNISSNASQSLGLNNYGGSGTPNGSDPDSLFSSDIGALGSPYSGFTQGVTTTGEQGYIAFTLDTVTGTQYGWMKVTLDGDGDGGVNGNVGTIHEWAYSDDTAFTVGQVPEPGSLMLLLVGSLGLLRRKR